MVGKRLNWWVRNVHTQKAWEGWVTLQMAPGWEAQGD